MKAIAVLNSSRRRKLTPQRITAKKSKRNWLKAFTEYLAGECYLAESTIRAYQCDLKYFLQWVGKQTISHLTVSDLADYVDLLHKRKLARKTLARHIVSMRLFFRYLQLEGIVQNYPAEQLGSQKLWHCIPQVLSSKEVERLLTAPVPGDSYWRRDRALLEMLYATGCRVSEVENLTLHDIHLDDKYCLCTGKGKKQRLVHLGNIAIEAFQEWKEIERTDMVARFGESNFAFLSYRGKKMSQRNIWGLVRKYARRAGITAKICTHTLRHSFATHMMVAGVDLRRVQEILGHASIATTQIYTHVDMSSLKEIHEKFHPRG